MIMRRMNLPRLPERWEEIDFTISAAGSGFTKISVSGKKGFLDGLSKERHPNRDELLHLLGHKRATTGEFQGDRVSIYKSGDFLKIEVEYPNTVCLGLGDKTGGVNRRGRFHFWNMDDANHGIFSDPLYQSHPIAYFISEGVGVVIVDSPAYQYWDISEYGAKIVVKDLDASVYVAEFFSLAEAYGNVAQFLGTFTLPPLWAIGYQQSRWSYWDEGKFRELSRRFQEEGIPCDVFYMDIDYMDGYRCFTVDRNRFPNLKALASEIDQKLVAIIDPGLKVDKSYRLYEEGMRQNFFMRDISGKVYTDRVWPGACHFPDFLDQGVREWWGDQYSSLLDMGIEGYWNDMNEPSTFSLRRTFPKNLVHIDGRRHGDVHNIYGLMMARGTYEGLRKLRPNDRPFVLTRSSYLGGQNFAWMWTGDNKSTWEFLKLSVRQMQSISISGQPLCGADVGGFSGNPDSELMVRWMQLGVFYPLFRNHTAYGTENQEPWEFPKVLQELRDAIRLRYKLLPYIYTQFFLSSLGLGPIIRPMTWIDKGVDERCMNRQFMFGEQMLVAPVLETTDNMEVILPNGIWHDFFTGEQFQGKITVEVDLSTIPLFVKSGSSIPLAKEVRQNAESTFATGIEIRNYGEDPKGLLYRDNGKDLTYRQGNFELYRLPQMECIWND